MIHSRHTTERLRTRRARGGPLARLAALLPAFVALVGCGWPYPYQRFDPCPAPALGEMHEGHAAIRVFYATDRRETDSRIPSLRFGIERTWDLTLGTCDVSIPTGHGRGRLEAPWLSLEPRADRHVALLDVSPPATEAAFWSDLRAAVEKSPNKEVFVFVHGFYATFADVTRRTAQIAHDTKLDGVAVTYSWPSQGWLLGYLVDASNVEWTEPHLTALLAGLIEKSGAERIHLMAHSMGVRVLVRAVRNVLWQRGGSGPDRPGQTRMFANIILAAADIDAELFQRDYARLLPVAADRVTIYCSAADWALGGAQRMHKYVRLGQLGPSDDGVLDRTDIIDATAVDRGPVGHMYYGESAKVLDDLHGILAGRSAAERGLRQNGRSFVIDP